MLRLRVLKGPDKGKTEVFTDHRVTVGDDRRNDFKLSDAMVSRFHGVFEVGDNGAYVYRDLGSLNGSYVRSATDYFTLHDRSQPQSIELQGPSRVAVGRTLIEVALNPKDTTEEVASASYEIVPEGRVTRTWREGATELRESVVRRVNETPERLAGRISTSTDRLQVLFRLSRRLNALVRIEDILERVVEATFEMFPLANFFAIVVPSGEGGGALKPLFTQLRDGTQPDDVILSQSLLQEVVARRESVLYVHDNLEGTDTRKSIVMAKITACLAAPLFGQRKLMGVMQLDSRGRSGMFGYDDLDLFTVMASAAAFAMERADLTRNIYDMFEAFVQASVAAIDSRDPTTAGHSQRVADYTLLTATRLGRATNGSLSDILFTEDELTELRYAALLHDFGKIGVREEVLQKASRLLPGTCNTLLQRVETAMAIGQSALLQELHKRLIDESRAPTQGDIAAMDTRVRALRARFEGYRQLIQRTQIPGPLQDNDRRLIEAMRQEIYVDALGQRQRLLSDDEASDLHIPYGTLNREERLHIESHAALSFDYLSRIPWSDELSQVPCIAGRHHEKLDGKGYPGSLPADEISHQVRILTICDIFDALTATDRPYKRARTADDALGILRHEADTGKLDGDLVEFFAAEVVPDVAPRLLRSREA